MPARPIPVQAVPAGAALAYSAPPADGDSVPPGGLVIVRNGSAAPVTVTVVTGGKSAGLDIADIPVSVPAATDTVLGPFLPRETFVQPSGTEEGRVLLTYSAVASVTRALVTS